MRQKNLSKCANFNFDLLGWQRTKLFGNLFSFFFFFAPPASVSHHNSYIKKCTLRVPSAKHEFPLAIAFSLLQSYILYTLNCYYYNTSLQSQVHLLWFSFHIHSTCSSYHAVNTKRALTKMLKHDRFRHSVCLRECTGWHLGKIIKSWPFSVCQIFCHCGSFQVASSFLVSCPLHRAAYWLCTSQKSYFWEEIY